MTNHAAQIVFLQSAPGDQWIGRLLCPDLAVDITYADRGLKNLANNPVMRCVISEISPTHYALVTQGPSAGSRRYSRFSTLTEAQEAAIKWAGRRFKIPQAVF